MNNRNNFPRGQAGYGYNPGQYGMNGGQMMGGYHPQQAGFYAPPATPYYAPAGANAPLASSSTERFIKGALIGAAAVYILTSPGVQNAVIKGTVKAWNLMQGGVEEVKERFRDAEAELQAEKVASEE